MEEGMKDNLVEWLRSAAFNESEGLEGKRPEADGYDFDNGVDYSKLLRSKVSGFQGTAIGEAIEIVDQMLDWRLADEAIAEDCDEKERDPAYRESVKCKVFLGFTSNLISSGVRDTVRYLVQHHMVDVIVTTLGGIEHDLIKCLAPTFIGDFSLPGALLRSKGLNSFGNLLVPDSNYSKFKNWIVPIFDQMLKEQKEENVLWTPSKVNARLGKEINDESSYLYWAYKNNIPVFCPAGSDGFIGNMFEHSPGLTVDAIQDTAAINNEALNASPRKTGMIILGGGSAKHHICNANMMRNGADFAVFINTAQEFDGSDSGARPDEAVSWGKIRASARTVKVHMDATVAFPLVVAETFASRREKNNCQKAAAAATELLTVKRFRAISLARAEELKQKEEVMKDSSIESVRSTVFKESEPLEGKWAKGYDFDKGADYSQLHKSMVSIGFQASNLGEAIAIVNQMLDWRLSDEAISEDCSEEESDPAYRKSVKCKVFLGFTSNIISSGLRDIIRYLVKHKMVDVVVTTAGGIEEDLIKCLAPTFRGDFTLPGALLRSKGLNRIGNLLIPNSNYCKFEDWIMPILDQMLKEQKEENVLWSPSKLIARLGKEINDESSYLYWAYKNNIPVFCPGITDGSLGDMLYFHTFRSPGMILDIVQDIIAINGECVHAGPRKTGMLVLGGGIPKHHICNANMRRNGADFAVFINTGHEFDGSDSGASIDEAVSRGMIRAPAKAVKVHCDATLAFPFLVIETFASNRRRKKRKKPLWRQIVSCLRCLTC